MPNNIPERFNFRSICLHDYASTFSLLRGVPFFGVCTGCFCCLSVRDDILRHSLLRLPVRGDGAQRGTLYPFPFGSEQPHGSVAALDDELACFIGAHLLAGPSATKLWVHRKFRE